MSNDQSPDKTNVIQFPGAKKESRVIQNSSAPSYTPPPLPPVLPKGKKQIMLGACVLAVALLSAAVNQSVFNSASGSADLASVSKGTRSIASVERASWHRDAGWEKRLAENLAKMPARDIASSQLGRAASVEEKLRWGILEEKYTIVYRPEMHKIDSILLQDPNVSPAYILDRMKFLKDFGPLLDEGVESAKLESVKPTGTLSDGRTVEAYTLFDKDKRPTANAQFELDRHHRLLSLKVDQI